MKTRFYWLLFAIVPAIALAIGAYHVGYLDAEKVLGNSHPTARGPLWYEWLGPVASTMAVIVALVLAFLGWAKEHHQRDEAVKAITSVAKTALQAELEITMRRLKGINEAVVDEPEKVSAGSILTKVAFPRPFGANLPKYYPMLPAKFVKQWATKETEFTAVAAQLDVFIGALAPRNVGAIKHEVDLLIKTTARYLVSVAPEKYEGMTVPAIMTAIDVTKT